MEVGRLALAGADDEEADRIPRQEACGDVVDGQVVPADVDPSSDGVSADVRAVVTEPAKNRAGSPEPLVRRYTHIER